MTQNQNAENNDNNNDSNTPVPANEVSAVEVQRFPEHFKATIKGTVQHRVGDGVLEEIPAGTAVQVDTAIGSYVLSWNDADGQPTTVSIAKREFELHVDEGAIQLKN